MLSKGSRRRTRVCAYTVYSPGRVLIVKILAVVVGCARGPGQILGHRCLRLRQPSDISLYHGLSLYSHPGPYQRAPRRRAAIGA